MSDVESRLQAQKYVNQATKFDHDQGKKIDQFALALLWYEKIEEKTLDDQQEIAYVQQALSDAQCRRQIQLCLNQLSEGVSSNLIRGESSYEKKMELFSLALWWQSKIHEITANDYHLIDTECRLQAKYYTDKARQSYRESGAIEQFLFALSWYAQLQVSTNEDKRKNALTSENLAIAYFNSKQHELAANSYWQSIQLIQQIPPSDLNDSDYRNLVGLYFDLSDACFHSYNQEAGDQAMINAILAFEQIKNKNTEEKQIGDPNQNFQTFRTYFEKKSSYPGYLDSSAYINHGEILKTHLEDQQTADLFSSFAISKEAATEINGIEGLIQELTLSNTAAKQPVPQIKFTPISLSQPTNDMSYRSMAAEILRLTQNHIQHGNISNTIKTYKQAIGALEKISSKNQSDRNTIASIEQQIKYLEAKPRTNHASSTQMGLPAQTLQSQNQKATTSILAQIGMFGQENTYSEELEEELRVRPIHNVPLESYIPASRETVEDDSQNELAGTAQYESDDEQDDSEWPSHMNYD